MAACEVALEELCTVTAVAEVALEVVTSLRPLAERGRSGFNFSAGHAASDRR